MKKVYIIISAILLLSPVVNAQYNESSVTRPAQVTFAYPIGTNGAQSMNYANNFSFNILYGLNGGAEGVEIGSIMNYNKGSNNGIQISGVANINTDMTNGLMLTGVANVCMGATSDLLISGVLNYSGEYSNGLLITGVANICMKSSEGLLLSGVANYSGKSSKGLLLTGVSNVCLDSTSGVMISGALNYSHRGSSGLQLSTINISGGSFEGFQLGVINMAKRLNGFQLGVINILGGVEKGIPFGVISLVKNGYFEFEMTAGEAIYSNFNYKMGVEQFYTIYKVGYSSYKDKPVYSYGMGFGSKLALSDNQSFCIDLSANSIVYNNKWDSKVNLLNKADFTYKHNIGGKLSLQAGPSVNVYVSREQADGDWGTLNVPYTIISNNWNRGNVSIWVGLNAGLALRL